MYDIYVYVYVYIYMLSFKAAHSNISPSVTSKPMSCLPSGLYPGRLGWEGDSTCHNGLEAPFALGGVLSSGTLVAQYLVVLGHKGLAGQGVKALGTAEAGVVPVAVLVVHLLGSDKWAAL